MPRLTKTRSERRHYSYAKRYVPLKKTIMRQTFLIITLLISGINLFGQKDKLTDLIVNSLMIYEPNPIHKEDSENSNKQFKALLIDTVDNFGTNIMEQFDNLYRSGLSQYEDNIDMRRVKMTQCLCLASIAILSDKDRFEYFIDLANHCITDSTGKALGLLEKQHCGLLLLKIYLDLNNKLDLQNDLTELNNKLDFYKASLPIDFYSDSKMMIKKHNKISGT